MMTPWLLQWRIVGSFYGCPMSLKNVWSHARCCLAELSSMYSDSIVDNMTMTWHLLHQEIAL